MVPPTTRIPPDSVRFRPVSFAVRGAIVRSLRNVTIEMTDNVLILLAILVAANVVLIAVADRPVVHEAAPRGTLPASRPPNAEPRRHCPPSVADSRRCHRPRP